MALPTLNVQLPYPFSKAEIVKVHVSANDTVENVINTAIQLAKDSNSPVTTEYGLFLSKKREWLFPSVKMVQYRNIFLNLDPNEKVQLRPKTMLSLEFTCLSYLVKIYCALDQKLSLIVNKLINILKRTPDAQFFGSSDWILFWENGEVSSDLTVQQALKLTDSFGLRKTTSRLKQTTDLPIFNQSIQNALARTSPTAIIPYFLEEIFKIIDSHADVEGLFRKSGQQTHVEEMANYIDSNYNINEVLTYLDQQPIHDITGVLKLYLKNLTNPVIPFSYYKQLESLTKVTDTNSRVIKTKQLLDTMPLANFAIIARFMEVLNHILMEESSKMTLTNLAICISGIIIKNPDTNVDPISSQVVSQNIIVDLLSHYRYYFKNEPYYGKTCHGIAIKDATYEGIEISVNEDVMILDSCPVDKPNMYQILAKSNKIFVPYQSIYVDGQNLFLTDRTVIENESLDQQSCPFATCEGIYGNHECYKTISDLTKSIQDKVSTVHEVIERLEDDPDVDLQEIEREINQISETFVV